MSFVASKRTKGHEKHLVRLPGTDFDLLPTALIYGANGSGKSNLVRGLEQLQTLVLNSFGKGSRLPYDPFMLTSAEEAAPTEYQIRLLLDGTLFEYGCAYTNDVVESEWLDVFDGEEPRGVFTREQRDGQVVITLGDGFKDDGGKSKLRSFAEVGVRAKQPFLSAVYNTLEEADQGPQLGTVIDWFKNKLVIIHPNAQFSGLLQKTERNDAFREFLGAVLQKAGTGVASLKVTSAPLDTDSSQPFEDLDDGDELMVDGPIMVRKDNGSTHFKFLLSEHLCADGEQRSLPFHVESDGTRRLAHLAPVLFQLGKTATTYVIDELDRNLHPALSRKFLELFLAERGLGAQILVTTHEAHLLDQDLLRRDEVWFMEKNPTGASEMYPLSDYDVRKDLALGKNYLRGRFGAVPVLGSMQNIESWVSDAPT